MNWDHWYASTTLQLSTLFAPLVLTSKDVSLRKAMEVTNFPIPLILFFPQNLTWFLLDQVLTIKYLLQSCQRTASQKDLGVGDGAALSPPVGRELASFPPACAPIPAAHCTTTEMHNSTQFQLQHTTNTSNTASRYFTIHTCAYCRTRLSTPPLPFTKISRQYSQSHNLSVSGQTTQRARTMTGCY